MTVDQTKASRRRPSADAEGLLRDLTEALGRVRRGDFSVRMPRASGDAGDAFNEVVALLEQRNRELMRIGRVVGREGRLTERLDEELFEGAWAQGLHAVNNLIDDLGRP